MAGAGNGNIVVLVDEVDNYTWINPNVSQLNDSFSVPFVRGAPRYREPRRVSSLRKACADGDVDSVRNGLKTFPREDHINIRHPTWPRAAPCFLVEAVQYGHADIAKVLIAAGADPSGPSVWLNVCSEGNHIGCAEVLLAAGADVNGPEVLDMEERQHFLPGSDEDDDLAISPLADACNRRAALPVVQLLSSYGARRSRGVWDRGCEGLSGHRTFTSGDLTMQMPLSVGQISMTAAGVAAMRHAHDAPLMQWLRRSTKWGLLEHLSDLLPLERARAFLRHGADLAPVPSVGWVSPEGPARCETRPGAAAYHIDLLTAPPSLPEAPAACSPSSSDGAAQAPHQQPNQESPTSLEEREQLAILRASLLRRSLALFRTPGAPQPVGAVQQLIARAAGPWTPETHALFPSAARASAVVLRQVGRRLRDDGEPWQQLPQELWEGYIMPFAINREMA